MQKSNELAGAPLVRFRQVKILEVQYETIAVLGSVDAARVAADDHAHLTELL